MTTELSITDQKVLEKYESFKNKLSEIEKEESSYQTNGMFYYNPQNSSTRVNIFQCSIEDILQVYSFIRRKSEDYYLAAKELGITQAPIFKWCEFSDEKWIADIKLSIRLKNSIELKERYRTAIKKLEGILPEELKKQMVLESAEIDDLPF